MFAGILLSAMLTDTLNQQNLEASRKEAREADQRQLENQKELLRYQTELQSDTNTIATQKGHAADAGVNPALLFSSLPDLASVSAGSAQGTMPNLPDFSKAVDKIHPADMSSLIMQNRQQALLDRQVKAQEQASTGAFMRDMSQAMENFRNTKFQKRMENVLYNKGMMELGMMGAQKKGIDISNIRAQLMLPGELQQQGLINDQISAQIRDTDERIKNYPVERAKLRADMRMISSNIDRNAKLNQVSDMDLKETQERYNGTVVQRIMQEYGLASRSFRGPGNLVDKTNLLLKDQRYVGAVAQLVSLGFSQDEAVATTLYYVATDPKDVGPSAINAVSRGLSALILKK